jgi:hypothetical protein
MLKYEDIKTIVEQPASKREKVNVDGKLVNVRKYHLTDTELAKLKEQYTTTGIFPNPYKRQGPYKAIIQALIDLGVNQYHSFATMRNKMRDIMQSMILANGKTAWDTFSTRSPINVESGKDLTGKIILNALIMQRTTTIHCYGMKLFQLGSSIWTKKENEIMYFMLNTTTAVPNNA